MLIELARATYDTDNGARKDKLKKYIRILHKRDCKEILNSITSKIEKAKVLTKHDIDIYQLAKKERVSIEDITYKYFHSGKIGNDTTRFIYIKGVFYPLPEVEREEYYKYAIMTKLLYEFQRHARNEEPCITLRRMMARFIPGSFNWGKEKLQKELEVAETENATYFGECPSDDSDSDDEENFQEIDKEQRDEILKEARKYTGKVGGGKKGRKGEKYTYRNRLSKADSPPSPDLSSRQTIVRPDSFKGARRQVNADLKKINESFKKGELTSDLLSGLKTKFLVAQYRGIHYLTTNWDKIGRRRHREMDECNKPQFSSSVLSQLGIETYHEFIDYLKSDGVDELIAISVQLEKQMLQMQDSGPVCYDGYAYDSLFYLLQEWYSANYDKLPGKIQADLDKAHSVFKKYLLNSQRPFVSTADVPYHALKYAYGIKLYEGHDHERLRPRWKKDGRAERPYSGKVYVSLHPLSDYVDKRPSHVTSLFAKGAIKLGNIIAAERETSFLGYIPEGRVFKQHKAKYPSFKKKYKLKYEEKYGIDEEMFVSIRENLRRYPPHSKQRRNLKRTLGEYLCAYYEVKLIKEAQQEAERRGAVLVYRDEIGGFSLRLPTTPTTRVERLKRRIMVGREKHRRISPHVDKKIRFIDKEKYALIIKSFCLQNLLEDDLVASDDLYRCDIEVLKLITKEPLCDLLLEETITFDEVVACDIEILKLITKEPICEVFEKRLVTFHEIINYTANELAVFLKYGSIANPIEEYGLNIEDLIIACRKGTVHLDCLVSSDEELADMILADAPNVDSVKIKYAQGRLDWDIVAYVYEQLAGFNEEELSCMQQDFAINVKEYGYDFLNLGEPESEFAFEYLDDSLCAQFQQFKQRSSLQELVTCFDASSPRECNVIPQPARCSIYPTK